MADPAPREEIEPVADAVEAYQFAQARALVARGEWIDHGSPLTLMQSNGVLGAHPLWKVMIEAETQASRLREKVTPKRPPGRPVGSSSAPDRKQPPAPLRAVS